MNRLKTTFVLVYFWLFVTHRVVSNVYASAGHAPSSCHDSRMEAADTYEHSSSAENVAIGALLAKIPVHPQTQSYSSLFLLFLPDRAQAAFFRSGAELNCGHGSSATFSHN